MAFAIQRLFIYPIKSLPPVEVSAVTLTNEGLRFDRSFVLVSPPGEDDEPAGVVRHFTIKKTFGLALFRLEIDGSWSTLTVTHASGAPPSSLAIPLTPSPLSLLDRPSYRVSIFGTSALGVDMGDGAASFFSSHLGFPARLLFMGGSGRREIPGAAYVPRQLNALSLALQQGMQPQRIRFADAAPLLVTSTASEQEARSRLPEAHRGEDVIRRLRPNIHIDVKTLAPAFDEDDWATLLVQPQDGTSPQVTIKCIFRCVRCLSLNADPETGLMIPRDRQLYGLLAKDRRVNEKFPHKPVFGQYAFAGPSGVTLRVGDKVVLAERKGSG
ncbi:hypothetical protein GQ53DRAFT_795930 [Thozetella sp. PMI_491]|nr:hypothetical protein GQ53DRAFT_795930 [Thozetella sp. PMI_491]